MFPNLKSVIIVSDLAMLPTSANDLAAVSAAILHTNLDPRAQKKRAPFPVLIAMVLIWSLIKHVQLIRIKFWCVKLLPTGILLLRMLRIFTTEKRKPHKIPCRLWMCAFFLLGPHHTQPYNHPTPLLSTTLISQIWERWIWTLLKVPPPTYMLLPLLTYLKSINLSLHASSCKPKLLPNLRIQKNVLISIRLHPLAPYHPPLSNLLPSPGEKTIPLSPQHLVNLLRIFLIRTTSLLL